MSKTPSGLTGIQRRYVKVTPEERAAEPPAPLPTKEPANAEDTPNDSAVESRRAAGRKAPKKQP